MIVSDASHAFPKEAKILEDRLVEIFKRQWELEKGWRTNHPVDHHKNEWNLLNYLARRAWRPLHHILRDEYVRIWGKRASFSYFFPQHTYNAIARRAYARISQEGST